MNLLSYHQHHKVPRTISERDKIADIVASLIRGENPDEWQNISESSASKSQDLQNLRSYGITACGISHGFLSKFLDKIAYFSEFNDKSKRNCDITKRMDVKEVLPLILDTNLLCLVSNYLGAPARLQKFTLSWSNRGESSESLNPQKFHRDRDDFKTLQLFIYLTNVNRDNGPHEYVPKTHTFEILKSSYNENIVSNGFNHKFLSFNELKKALGQEKPKILTLTGPAGSAFLEDTGGFHRGTVPHLDSSPRLMLGITWSLAKGTGFVNIGRDQLNSMMELLTLSFKT